MDRLDLDWRWVCDPEEDEPDPEPRGEEFDPEYYSWHNNCGKCFDCLGLNARDHYGLD